MKKTSYAPAIEQLEFRALTNSFIDTMSLYDLPADLSLTLLVRSSDRAGPLSRYEPTTTPNASPQVDLVCQCTPPWVETRFGFAGECRTSPAVALSIPAAASYWHPGDDEGGGRSWEDGKYLVEDYTGSAYTFKGLAFSGKHVEKTQYQVGAENWVVRAIPASPKGTKVCATENFVTVLAAAFPDWTLNCSANSLSDGSLKVKTHEAVFTGTAVGIDFQVAYVGGAGDPTTNIHWIQVVQDNHSFAGGHGDPENLIDNGGAPTPYYDALGAADTTGLADKPRRPDENKSHTWSAELYLVQETGPNTVTLWAGVNWGWNNGCGGQGRVITLPAPCPTKR